MDPEYIRGKNSEIRIFIYLTIFFYIQFHLCEQIWELPETTPRSMKSTNKMNGWPG